MSAEVERDRVLSFDEEQRLLAHCTGERAHLKPILVCALDTAMRRGEPAEGESSIGEPLMSEAEAARFLGISKMTLLRKRNVGEIDFFRVGFRILYSKEKHLLPFLRERENG
jgi:excisionase family DNA binding protein